jgi:ubiquinone/menaquinone biosynthesis C-methylase UbiE
VTVEPTDAADSRNTPLGVPPQGRAAGRSIESEDLIRGEYADASNLNVRIQLHRRFSTNKQDWYTWVYDQFDVPECCRILELGCGPGRLWRSNFDRIPSGWTIVLVDFSPGMLAEAKRNLARAAGRFIYQVADARAIPFGSGTFDAVVANHMLYHVPDVKRVLGEIGRVLRPEGRLYASTNGMGNMPELRDIVRRVAPELPFSDNLHIRRFCLENGASLLEQVFSNVVLRRYENALDITEAEPVVAYYRSTIGAGTVLTGEKVGRLRRMVQEQIDGDGSIHVSLDTGMFVATRAKDGANCPRKVAKI